MVCYDKNCYEIEFFADITNSTQFIELLGNSFPYLVDAGVTNLGGKIVISIIIGASIVLFTSFFQAP